VPRGGDTVSCRTAVAEERLNRLGAGPVPRPPEPLHFTAPHPSCPRRWSLCPAPPILLTPILTELVRTCPWYRHRRRQRFLRCRRPHQLWHRRYFCRCRWCCCRWCHPAQVPIPPMSIVLPESGATGAAGDVGADGAAGSVGVRGGAVSAGAVIPVSTVRLSVAAPAIEVRGVRVGEWLRMDSFDVGAGEACARAQRRRQDDPSTRARRGVRTRRRHRASAWSG
jgi:hypothetical protein